MKWAAPNLHYITPGTPERYEVQGSKASSYEHNFAWALDKAGIGYIFQYQLFGGRSVLGGQVLDFLVLTEPLSTPVWINGEYWHKGPQRLVDFHQQVMLDFMMQGQMMPAVELWGKDVGDFGSARNTVRRLFGQ